MNLLIDSSIYIDWMRKEQDVPALLRPWIVRGECFMNGLIRAEVLRGIRRERQRDRMSEIYDVMNEAPMNSAYWRRVSLLAWNLDRMGVVLPLPDVAIAQTAIDCQCTIITLDNHFSQIPKLNALKELPPA
jgi:predicted nucleic acid-binding protein